MIYVTGMHRSGTSFFANLLRDLGVNFGPDDDLLAAQSDNPEGFAELESVVRLHDRILADNSASWFSPKLGRDLAGTHKKELAGVRARAIEKGIEAIKDPRLSLFLDDWLRPGDDVWVCLREPDEVCRSLFKRDGFPAELSAALWLIYNKAVREKLHNQPHEIVWFSELHSMQGELASALQAKLGRLQKDVLDILGRRFKAGLVTKDTSPVSSMGEISSLARRIYAECRRSRDLSPLDSVELDKLVNYAEGFSSLVAASQEYRVCKREYPELIDRANRLQDLLDQRNEEFDRLATAHKQEVEEHKLTAERLIAADRSSKEFEQQLERQSREIDEFRRSFFGRVVYRFFIIYKVLTRRRASVSFLDTVFRSAEPKRPEIGQSRFRIVLGVIDFCRKNPSIAVRNLTWRNLKIMISRLTGSRSDLQQWVNSRIPVAQQTHEWEVEQVVPGEIIEFQKFKKPHVSIVVPVYNHLEITLSLLKSIVKNTHLPYEIIIADDNSTDGTKDIGATVKGVVHVRNVENMGFLLNCNNAAKYAKGEFIVFLNNDTNVTNSWLEHLLRPFEDASVGVVGPKVLFKEGLLQEAGGIVWKDASAWNYGRMQNPESPEYNYLKEVDYVSGCCLMIRRSLWEEVGGFDSRYVPAYYEDTDICFEARKHGYKVVYQPASSVIHLEGASHGTDVGSGIKQYQVINCEKFRDKWAAVLADHYENGNEVFRARDRSWHKPCVLFIDHYVPWFDKDAGSRAVFMYLQVLVGMGYNIKFVGDNFYKHEPYTSTLEQMGVEVLYGNHYAANIETWISENAANIDVAFVNRPHVAERYIDLLKSLEIHTVYFGHDLHFLRIERQAELQACERSRQEAEDWKQRELELIEKSDVVYYPSSVEVDLLRSEFGVMHSEVLPLFSYPSDDVCPSYEPAQRSGLLFVGSFGHPPNVDAVEWFYDQVFPSLAQEAFPIYIVGSNVPEHIRKLSSENFQVLGYQSDEELESLYRKVKLVVVPLRFGAGVKGKVLEAMFHGVPVVASSIALEGVERITSCAYEANTAEEFSNAINVLVESPEELNDMSGRSKAFIRENFNPERIEQAFAKGLTCA